MRRIFPPTLDAGVRDPGPTDLEGSLAKARGKCLEQDPMDVSFYGIEADAEQPGNLLESLPLVRQAQNLALAW